MGFYIGIGGVVTYSNAKKMVEVVENIGIENIVVETDCPYLAPTPFRGKRNNPSMVKLVAQRVSEVKKVPIETVTEITYKNANEIFNI